MRSKWWTVVMTMAVVFMIVGPAWAGDRDVCPPGDSGKVDVTGERPMIVITAPDGFLISGYCVKAGSVNQGEGPELTTVPEPSPTVVLVHSSGKAISHYSYTLVPIEQPPPPPDTTTTTVPVPEPPPTTTTTLPPVEPEPPVTTTTAPPPPVRDDINPRHEPPPTSPPADDGDQIEGPIVGDVVEPTLSPKVTDLVTTTTVPEPETETDEILPVTGLSLGVIGAIGGLLLLVGWAIELKTRPEMGGAR